MATRILVLPGIGDIYWVAVALRGFIRARGLGTPELHIWDFDGRPRALEYVERIPFVTAGGYWTHTHKVRGFRESYVARGRSVWSQFHGFDFYLSANGSLRHGRTVEQTFGGCAVDWDLPLRVTDAEAKAADEAQAQYGRYLVAFFSEHGMFPKWVAHWGVDGCAAAIDRIAEASGLTVLLTGSEWDREFSEQVRAACRSEAVVNLAGETDLDQFFGLVRGAAACFGWCGGNTIHATHTRVPTVIVWSRTQFPNARFYRNACRPDAWREWYDAAVVEDETPAQAADKLIGMLA